MFAGGGGGGGGEIGHCLVLSGNNSRVGSFSLSNSEGGCSELELLL